MFIKSILITGTSTGFGYDTAETLKRAGHVTGLPGVRYRK